MLTVSDIVAREVHYCVSAMVSTIAAGYGAIEPRHTSNSNNDLADAAEQAMELCSPLADYESAALEAGATINEYETDRFEWESDTGGHDDGFESREDAARDFCNTYHLEPCEREVFEHWIVSDWLAEKLAAHGEKVDTDFMGLTVWARTTTGQGIASDSVIERIHADLIRDYSGVIV